MNIEEWHKQEEIRQYIKDSMADYIDTDLDDLHNNLFNTDYYIIGTYKATQWLGDKAMNVINIIKDYEQDSFGECNTDFSDAEKVVNMYVYILGEELLRIGLEGFFQGDEEPLNQEHINNITNNLNKEVK